jgi:hypothetical protein
MNLQLSDTLKHLKASAFDALDISVDWEAFVVHPLAGKRPIVNGPLSNPLTQNLWAASPEPRDERQLSCVRVLDVRSRRFRCGRR